MLRPYRKETSHVALLLIMTMLKVPFGSNIDYFERAVYICLFLSAHQLATKLKHGKFT